MQMGYRHGAIFLQPEVSQVCNLGHTHIIEPEKYRIPSKEEMSQLKIICWGWRCDDQKWNWIKKEQPPY